MCKQYQPTDLTQGLSDADAVRNASGVGLWLQLKAEQEVLFQEQGKLMPLSKRPQWVKTIFILVNL